MKKFSDNAEQDVKKLLLCAAFWNLEPWTPHESHDFDFQNYS